MSESNREVELESSEGVRDLSRSIHHALYAR